MEKQGHRVQQGVQKKKIRMKLSAKKAARYEFLSFFFPPHCSRTFPTKLNLTIEDFAPHRKGRKFCRAFTPPPLFNYDTLSKLEVRYLSVYSFSF